MNIDLINNPTQQQLTGLDLEQCLYRGREVPQAVYEPLDYGFVLMSKHFGEGNYTGQEVYLGYSPSKDRFYMAIEGNQKIEDDEDPLYWDWGDMESSVFVIEVTEDHRLNWELYRHYPCSFYDTNLGESPYKQLSSDISDMLDIRLD